MGGHIAGEVNGLRDERKRGAVSSSRGAYHGKFCSSDLSAEREPSSIMYMMDL